MAINLSVAERPPYAAYERLKVPGFAQPLYVTWFVDPEPDEAGVDPGVAHILAESWSYFMVLFLKKVSDGRVPIGTWSTELDGSSAARVGGKISGLCATSDPAVIETMFDQSGYDWSQQGQFALFFPLEVGLGQLPPVDIASAILKQNFEQLSRTAPLKGYVKPGDDGDFFEIGFATDALRQQWLDVIQDFAYKRGTGFSFEKTLG